jgi:hypothetical protein
MPCGETFRTSILEARFTEVEAINKEKIVVNVVELFRHRLEKHLSAAAIMAFMTSRPDHQLGGRARGGSVQAPPAAEVVGDDGGGGGGEAHGDAGLHARAGVVSQEAAGVQPAAQVQGPGGERAHRSATGTRLGWPSPSSALR